MNATTVADWAAEYARTGKVRILPRRRVAAIRALVSGVVLANLAWTVGSAASGDQSWWTVSIFAALAMPLFVVWLWKSARALLFERPALAIDSTGVALGRRRLAWDEIEAVAGPGSLRRRPAGRRKPVDSSREWFDSVTLVPSGQRRGRQISVDKVGVADLEGLASWFNDLRQQHQTRV